RGERGRPDAERHHGVEEPRAVDVERYAALVGDGRDPGRGGDADRLVTRVAVGVLDRDEARQRLVRVGWVAERRGDLVRVEGPVWPVPELQDARPDDDRVA